MRIAIVGDVLLDVDLLGSADRLSPDAPVPVIDVQQTERRAGGAGLVATMLARDGHDVTLVTVLSDDERSGELRDAYVAMVRRWNTADGDALSFEGEYLESVARV